jgi:DNA-binding HxlR family transcriptional regulator|tara:strand:- start:236 stop:679 length:444 start_codon:yes stop_codon:yes gene_type:complete
MINVSVYVMKNDNVSVFGFKTMNDKTLFTAKILSGKYALEILDYIYKNTNASTLELCEAVTGTSYKNGNKIHYVMRNLRKVGLIKKDAEPEVWQAEAYRQGSLGKNVLTHRGKRIYEAYHKTMKEIDNINMKTRLRDTKYHFVSSRI